MPSVSLMLLQTLLNWLSSIVVPVLEVNCSITRSKEPCLTYLRLISLLFFHLQLTSLINHIENLLYISETVECFFLIVLNKHWNPFCRNILHTALSIPIKLVVNGKFALFRKILDNSLLHFKISRKSVIYCLLSKSFSTS